MRSRPCARATPGSPSALGWRTIVRNRSLNDLRDEPGPHEELDNQYDGVPQPPMIAAQRQELRDVVVAIGALPEAQRRALVGRELEGLSHEQIAAELGVTPGGARGLIFRARAGVRDALGGVDPAPDRSIPDARPAPPRPPAARPPAPASRSPVRAVA